MKNRIGWPSLPPSALKTVNDGKQLNIGDILYRRKALVMHVGIYLGDGLILHNTPKKGEHQVDFATFAQGKTVHVKTTGLAPAQVIEKAQQVLANPASYQLLKHNCEHTANTVLSDTASSDQLNEIWAWTLIGAAFGKSFGRKTMVLGGIFGALGGLLSLPRMFWTKWSDALIGALR